MVGRYGGPPPSKKLKTSSNNGYQANSSGSVCLGHGRLLSLNRSITPPLSRNQQPRKPGSPSGPGLPSRQKIIPSPIQLTHIRDISDSTGYNEGCVKLRDILGDPMIKECWQFNYLFDVDYIMGQFDRDVKDLIQLKIIHGSWKKEAPNRIAIDDACKRYPNAEAVVAYMPEPFGTHHSKMMILIRHDNLAQIIIHTANMIPRDWGNMTQAVWRSPLLPLSQAQVCDTCGGFGSSARFKRDLLAYLEAYHNKTINTLIRQLQRYDFGSVKAVLIASVPTRLPVKELDSNRRTLWGWPALKDAIGSIPIDRSSSRAQNPHIIVQVSSIATLGQTDRWLKETFLSSLYPQPEVNQNRSTSNVKFSIIFPTPDEIRRSLDGYGSGGSIHMKIQSPSQQKQLAYLRRYLCHWAGDAEGRKNSDPTTKSDRVREAGRRRAAPHIKTYIRFSDSDMNNIDWAMITSANLSTQAWGAGANTHGEVRICSWEIGVLIWPDLFREEHIEGCSDSSLTNHVKMIPCFKRNTPSEKPLQSSENDSTKVTLHSDATNMTRVGLRMPYDLPLIPYTPQEVPWCATAVHQEPDWMGQTWEESD
ncbi:Tyrosyl-DNA phosphodiesterase I [Trichophyton interdigitale]|uniref:Tyrosyl-DNA phosphodiesterase I n=1 Tax=Trichophyton interdigitale TaxID=101480 RepID=A0A9P4YFH8_9EURO|nr:Tyrosyl-DNA phosphodiesterase I [Trichophyton interdigitale]KAF3892686.1 Tyrosyl-DNA phosphodiesterase I [Trichophyton interdigitale]KAG8207798.1 Tyrosyl-DNA phosphodiesterase I [Trichophyton interdigitale]